MQLPTPAATSPLHDVPVLAAAGSAMAVIAAVAVAWTAAGPLGVCGALLGAAALGLLGQGRREAGLRRRLTASEHRARLDPLTGLLNRTGVLDELARRLRDRRPTEIVGVLFLDVDRLKVINHSIGHRAGDEVLEAVAARLRSVLRPGDAVGRLGGDEFVVVISGFRSVADLDRLAERVLAQLGGPVALADGSHQVATASIGIAYVLKGEATAQDLLRDADIAIHRAKDGGGSRYAVFDAELRAQAVARVELERELRRAVRDGELVVQYQPVVTAATGGIELVEALVRWRHPTRGLIPPGQFLTVASESGLIIELGEQVLASACREAAGWSMTSGRPIGVAVNLAERQLLDQGLVATVAGVLRSTGLPARQLHLEISEEVLAHRPEPCVEVLRRLSALGVRLALDDFGTARASLRQLKALDMIHTLKLDRAFVAEVVDDAVDRTIVTAVMALARSLGMEVVAEGVETAEQAAVLADLGVHHLQGFHLQRPVAAESITPLLRRPVAALRAHPAG